MTNIHGKLMKIQEELKAPKGQYNSFGKYNYRSCEDILEGLKPLLSKYKATLVIHDEIVQIGGRYYVKATATLYDTEKEGSIHSTAYAREDEKKTGMDLSQLTGSTSSYARKYALNGLFAIDDTKDSDFTNTHGKVDKDKSNNYSSNSDKGITGANKPLTEGQIKRLYAIGYAAGIDAYTVNTQIKKKFNKEVKDLTKEEYEQVCNGYEKLKK